MTDAATDTKTDAPFLDTHGAVKSNHNSLHEVNPVRTMAMVGKTDYNPMRATPNRANDATDVTLVPESAAHLVDTKGGAPTAAEAGLAGKDVIGNDMDIATDTVVTDSVTLITTRPGTSLAEKNADADRDARAASSGFAS